MGQRGSFILLAINLHSVQKAATVMYKGLNPDTPEHLNSSVIL